MSGPENVDTLDIFISVHVFISLNGNSLNILFCFKNKLGW